MNKLYDYLVKNKIKKVSDHELSCWPRAFVEELAGKNLLKKAENGTQIYCDSCDDNCPIDDYDIVEIPEKGKMAAFVCPEKKEMGFITAPLSRRRYWLFIRPKRIKRVPKPQNHTMLTKEPLRLDMSCFVSLPDGIGFYSDKELKKLPFQADSQALTVLPMFIKGSLSPHEIKQYAQSNDNPRSIVKNMNKSILTRLHKVGFTNVKKEKFIYFDDDSYSYKVKYNIITQEQYEDLIRPLKS